MSDLFLLNPKSEINDEIEAGFIPMACVEDGFSGNHSFETRKWKDIKKGYCHFQNGDIGVAKISPCFENMKSCILNSLPNGVGTGTTELVILRSLGVYAPFYLYLFKSSWYISQGTKYFKGVVGQQRVNKAIFTELEVPLPSVAEQKKIVAEIKRWFALIDIIEQDKSNLQETIKQAKSRILDLAIYGKLVPQDPTDEPANELLKRINPKAEITCDNQQYGKPKGWCECTIGSLFLFIRNGVNIRQDKSKIGFPITRIETISSEFIDRLRMGYAAISDESYSDYYLQKDDILMSHINSPIHIGKCALCDIKPGEKIIHGMNLLCLRPYPDIISKYILMVFRSTYFKNEIRPFIKNAVNQASINIRNLSSAHLLLPPVPEQHRIVAKIEELFAQLDNIASSL